MLNKITVALDFTTRTSAAGLNGTGSASAAFLTAAHNVLSGVDSTSLNDASVTAGEAATTTFITSGKTGSALAAAADGPIVISASNSVIDPGTGGSSIQFIAGAGHDTVVLHQGATDLISGFDPAAGDALDVRGLFAASGLNAADVMPNLGAYLTVAGQGADAALLFDPTGHGGGNVVAVLTGLGGAVPNTATLTGRGAVLTLTTAIAVFGVERE